MTNIHETLQGFSPQSEEFSASSEQLAAATQEQTASMNQMTFSTQDLTQLADTVPDMPASFNLNI